MSEDHIQGMRCSVCKNRVRQTPQGVVCALGHGGAEELGEPSQNLRLYTHSSAKAFKACLLLYWIKYILGYRPVKTSKPLAFGTLIHHCLEAYWRCRAKSPEEQGIGPLAEALKTLHEKAGEANLTPYELVRAIVMINAYAAVWDQVVCKVLAVEAKFTTALLHPDTRVESKRFLRSGKIDLILQMEDGSVVVVEHKTSAADISAGSPYRVRLSLDEQVSFYYAGAISLGFRPQYIIYDVLRKFREAPKLATPTEKRIMVKDRKTKEMRLKANQRDKDETTDEYGRRLSETVAKDPEAYIVRIKLQRLPNERKKFALEVWNHARIMAFAIDEGIFPRNSDSCFRFGSPCDMVPHCYQGVPLENPNVFRKLDELHPELIEDEEEENEGSTAT